MLRVKIGKVYVDGYGTPIDILAKRGNEYIGLVLVDTLNDDSIQSYTKEGYNLNTLHDDPNDTYAGLVEEYEGVLDRGIWTKFTDWTKERVRVYRAYEKED